MHGLVVDRHVLEMRWRHRWLRVVMRPRLMHRMNMLLLLVMVPVWSVLLRILGHHWPHLLSIVRGIARHRPHMRRHGGIGAIMPTLGRLHGHMLPIRHVVWVHGGLCLGGSYCPLFADMVRLARRV
jgi:hypothetical protein